MSYAIAIDGPSGAGKSTIAKRGAKKLEDIDNVAADPETKAEEYKKLKKSYIKYTIKNLKFLIINQLPP